MHLSRGAFSHFMFASLVSRLTRISHEPSVGTRVCATSHRGADSQSAAPRLVSALARSLAGQSKVSCVEGDVEALLARMRQRMYPETLPVLASYWLKAVEASGYGRQHWKEWARLLQQALREELLDGPSRQALVDIQTRIQQAVFLQGRPPRPRPPRSERVCATLSSDLLQPYINRLLNEWLSMERGRLLAPKTGGGPPLVTGTALEGLLVRERLSPRALEMLLQHEPFSPLYVYPADVEILQDVVLFLLRRTRACPRRVIPASLICVARDSLLPANYREAVHHAFLTRWPRGGEVHVPIRSPQALEILETEPARIGSVLVTMDGRWWEAVRLQTGDSHAVVYRPMGRLRLDYEKGDARLRVPCPETPLSWSGRIPFPETFEIFGREWRLSRWELDGKRAWLHLAVSRVLSMTEDARFERWKPASVEMAWSALEDALASSIVQGSSEPIERLRDSDLIPLGRAIFELARSLKSRRLEPCEVIENQLRDIRSLEAQVSLKYGRVPWRILPPDVQASFFKIRSDRELVELLNEVFDSLPEQLSAATAADPRPGKGLTFAFATLRRLTTPFARNYFAGKYLSPLIRLSR